MLMACSEAFHVVHAGNVKCEVVGFMRKIMNGGYYPWAPRSGAGYVDVDDVAAAHTLAMLTPKASGRCVHSDHFPLHQCITNVSFLLMYEHLRKSFLLRPPTVHGGYTTY